MSHTDELSMDNQPISLRMIKPEPFVTSTPDDQTSVTSFTAEEASRKPNRNRHGTLRGLETSGEGNCPGPKRKRDHGATLPSSSPALTTSAKLGFVLATRNFPRTSSTLINDIVAHKVANLFAKPLTDREAPGYKDLIYRPQDLKSIRTAIANGSKALNAAIETTPPEGNPSSIWIPETPDVVPPKGIVNSAQLEKELMRMLANAVMFNPDLPTKRGVGPAFRTRARTLERGITYDDGIEEGEEVTKGKEDVSVVKDTREMFEAVERKVGEWRSAERAAEEVGAQGAMARLRGVGEGADDEEPDELAGEEVVGSVEVDIDVGEPRVKRRRR